MSQKIQIPLQEYHNQFQAPFMAALAQACQEHIKISGVKNCFIIKSPLFLPDQLTPQTLLFQKKTEDLYECCMGKTVLAVFQSDEDFKDCIAKSFCFYQNEDQYGLCLSIPNGPEYSFLLEPIVTGVYHLSITLADETADTNILANYYDIEKEGNHYMISLPNIHTRYAVRRIIDFLQFVVRSTI